MATRDVLRAFARAFRRSLLGTLSTPWGLKGLRACLPVLRASLTLAACVRVVGQWLLALCRSMLRYPFTWAALAYTQRECLGFFPKTFHVDSVHARADALEACRAALAGGHLPAAAVVHRALPVVLVTLAVAFVAAGILARAGVPGVAEVWERRVAGPYRDGHRAFLTMAVARAARFKADRRTRTLSVGRVGPVGRAPTVVEALLNGFRV